LPCGEPSQSRCARQLPQGGSQGGTAGTEVALRGNPLGWGCPLSLASRDSSPKGGAKGERRGTEVALRGALSVSLRETAPPRGEPRGNGGDGRFVGQGFCPCRTSAHGKGKGRALALRSEAATEKVGRLGRIAPPEQPLCRCGDISPFRGDKEFGDLKFSSKSPASPERGGARRSGRRGSPAGCPRSPQVLAPPLGELSRAAGLRGQPPFPRRATPVPRSLLGSPFGGAVLRSKTERASRAAGLRGFPHLPTKNVVSPQILRLTTLFIEMLIQKVL
jgi:hypothetical protein